MWSSIWQFICTAFCSFLGTIMKNKIHEWSLWHCTPVQRIMTKLFWRFNLNIFISIIYHLHLIWHLQRTGILLWYQENVSNSPALITDMAKMIILSSEFFLNYVYFYILLLVLQNCMKCETAIIICNIYFLNLRFKCGHLCCNLWSVFIKMKT